MCVCVCVCVCAFVCVYIMLEQEAFSDPEEEIYTDTLVSNHKC